MGVVKVKRAEAQEYVPLIGLISLAGMLDRQASASDKALGNLWRSMMERCYGVDNKYAKSGIFVCQRWHNPRNFILDAKTLPRWQHKLANWDLYQLDKDYYGANYYSPATCVWLTSLENNAYRANAVVIVATNPFGVAKVYLSPSACASALGCATFAIQQQLDKGVRMYRAKKLLGWEFETYKGTNIYRHTL